MIAHTLIYKYGDTDEIKLRVSRKSHDIVVQNQVHTLMYRGQD